MLDSGLDELFDRDILNSPMNLDILGVPSSSCKKLIKSHLDGHIERVKRPDYQRKSFLNTQQVKKRAELLRA